MTEKDNIRFQYGGVAIIAHDEAAGRYMGSGRDPTGLGRWCWMQLRGYGGKTVLLVSAYRPCLNSGGADTVWSHHWAYFDKQNPPRNKDPLEAFGKDLLEDLQKFHQRGSQIVLCMDTNLQQLRAEGNCLERVLAHVGIRDIVLHNNNRQQAPGTTSTGQHPVDSICTGSTLLQSPSGYLSIPVFTNHRGIFIDIGKVDVFGHESLQPFVPPSARKLITTDPRIVAKYNSALRKFCRKHDLPTRAFALDANTVPYPSARTKKRQTISTNCAHRESFSQKNNVGTFMQDRYHFQRSILQR